jgi:ABC-2 type transport system ATP-binding protein
MDPSAAVISARGLTRRFDGKLAVDGLSLDVAHGTILGVIGPSGSGKTTTIRMLTGSLARTAGECLVLGDDPMHFRRRTRAEIAYMPQQFSLYEDLTARENVGFVAALYGIGPFRRGGLIRRALQVVDLWEERNKLARELSGGMQRRLELACALVHSPSVLFIDEPTAGIDPLLRQSIWGELRRLRSEGRTLLVTTQYVSDAEYCDRVALISDGQLVALDEPGTLRRMVFGGEVLDLATARAVDPEMLASVPGLMNVRQPEARRLIIVTQDAAVATPRIIETLRRQGVEVGKLEEYQPSFDEVFASLVEQRRATEADSARPVTDLTTSADPRADALADAARSAELDRSGGRARTRAGSDAVRGPEP